MSCVLIHEYRDVFMGWIQGIADFMFILQAKCGSDYDGILIFTICDTEKLGYDINWVYNNTEKRKEC